MPRRPRSPRTPKVVDTEVEIPTIKARKEEPMGENDDQRLLPVPRSLLNLKTLITAAVIIALVPLSFMLFGINYAGYRTVIQYPTGGLVVKFSPGIYMQWFGHVTAYPDIITFDFDKQDKKEVVTTVGTKGIAVRYQDGGMGHVYGLGRFNLPNDEASMIALHKAFRDYAGVAHKLIRPETEQSANLTAGLMTSEEAYAEKRTIYIEWMRSQVQLGKFKTRLEQKMDVDKETGRQVVRNVPVIEFGKDGFPQHLENDLKVYGITVSGFQVTDWDFEEKTLAQIATKRDATMGIITAKANAERAKQEAITAEEQGKKEVVTAQYQKEQEKIKAVVDAQKEKEVAVIGAKKLVDVAEQQKLEAEQKKLAAEQYKQEQILRGTGDAERKRLVLAADGALEQKLEAYKYVMERFSIAIGKQKWVPEIMFGPAGQDPTKSTNNAQALVEIFTAMALKQLGLDISVPTGKPAQTNR